MPKEYYYELSYEDFVQHPQQYTKELMEFIDLGMNDKQKKFINQGMGGGISPKSVEAYLERLSPNQIERVERIAGTLLRDLGYLY